MDRKIWYFVGGAALIIILLLFRACQSTETAAPTPSAPTAVPTIPNTATPKPQPTNTSVPKPTETSGNNPIQGINWLWISLKNQTTGEIVYVPNPAAYTIVFHTDGTVTGLADCNSYSGAYDDKNGLTIRITSSTNAACAEGSLDQEFLKLLDSVVAGGPDGSGGLALENAGGEKRMEFQNGGSAPQ